MKKRIKLSEKDLDVALKSIKKNDSDLYFSLGVGLQREYAPHGIAYVPPSPPSLPRVRYTTTYAKIGRDFWLDLSSEIYYLLCDPNNKQPKDWVHELISGDIRNLLTGVITVITSTYHVGLGIAVPATALVIKKGLVNYCKRKPRKRIKKTVKIILNERKKSMGNKFI